MGIRNIREYLEEYKVLESFMHFIETGGRGVDSNVEEIHKDAIKKVKELPNGYKK